MKKLLTFALVLLLASSFVLAGETSKFDAGLRLGIMNTFGGVSARMALSETSKVEASITTPAFAGTIVTGTYQIHHQVGDVKDLTWYFGGGLHMGYWSNAAPKWNGTTVVNRDFALGLDALVGIQYSMKSMIDFPLLISLDYKPAYDIFGYWATNWGGVALSLRYAF